MRPEEITLLILAGGQGQRMGGVDKGWHRFEGRPLIKHVLERLRSQVGQVVISANRSLDEYRALGVDVVADREAGYQGPLMGIWSGLMVASTPWVMIVPCDTPALPSNLIQRMAENIGNNSIAVASDGARTHPVVALIRRDLADDLEAALLAGERKIMRWYGQHDLCEIDFSDCPEEFANLNSPQDSQALSRRWLARKD